MWKPFRDKPNKARTDGGYSLIELVVTIAVLSVVGVGIGTLMTSATRLYGMQSAEVRLSSKAQTLVSQLRSYYLHAQDDMVFEDKDAPDTVWLNHFPGADACLVYHADGATHAIVFSGETNRLYLAEEITTKEELPDDIDVLTDHRAALLCDGVEAYAVELTEADGGSGQKAVTTLTLNERERTYESSFVTALRNDAIP